MVDWDRVEELRSKGWDWDDIADDPKVGFHPDRSVKEEGRALRALYHRQRSRRERQAPAPTPTKRKDKESENKWTLIRLGFLLVSLLAIWAVLAYLAPSPVGLLVPAIPWLAITLAVVAFLLIYGLLRAEKRWLPVYRSTLIGGVVLGLIIAGMIGLVGVLVFGCPLLPPGSALSSQPAGWTSGTMTPWQDGGKPVLYFYGATWCPYCSASSWAIYKALTAFGSLSGAYQGYSYGSPEPYQYTPEMILANAQLSSNQVAFEVSEYVAGSDGVSPTTSSCYQSAYVTAYSGGAIPFVVVNGQYIHAGTGLVDPGSLTTWAGGSSGGTAFVLGSVINETGTPWSSISNQACWVMAFLAKSAGLSQNQVNALDLKSQTTKSQVWTDVGLIS
ncbi:MAG TPA: DUF929 family protein [Thermoplasmata archaeon]|nr:DUF929 family protein [Thermoplasmata archaeon]